LGLRIERDWAARTVSISLEKLIGEALERFHLAEAPRKPLLVSWVPLTQDATQPPLDDNESSVYLSILGTVMYWGP
jgi:hypothetical protein